MSNEWVMLHGGALGDLALTVQFALRVLRPSCLQLVSRADLGDLATCRPSIARVSSEGMGGHWLYGDGATPPNERLRHQIEGRCVFNTLAGSEHRVHQRLLELRPRTLVSLDPAVDWQGDRHAHEQWSARLDASIHVDTAPPLLDEGIALEGDPHLRERGRELLAERGCDADTIVIHCGAGGRDKCWPLDCYLRVADLLCESRRPVCFVMGEVEAERWCGETVRRLEGRFPVLNCPTPTELSAVLSAADVLVGNDSGPGHLAALLGTPTVSLFGPTSATVWRPIGPYTRVIEGTSPSGASDWGITVERVLEEINAVSDMA